MNIPIHPIIRLRMAQMFVEEYKLSQDAALDSATKLIGHLRDRDMDVIKGNWMAAPMPLSDRSPRFRWEDIADKVAEIESSGRVPWDTPELRG